MGGGPRVAVGALTSILVITTILCSDVKEYLSVIFQEAASENNLWGNNITIDSGQRQLFSLSDFADPQSSVHKLPMAFTQNNPNIVAGKHPCLEVRGQLGTWIPFEGYDYEHPIQVDFPTLEDTAQQQRSTPEFQPWTQWIWQDNLPQCQLEAFTPGRFCKVMEYLQLKRIFFVGDSLTAQMVNSFLSQLYMTTSLTAAEKKHEDGLALTFDCGGHSENFELVFIRNDHLSLRKSHFENCAKICNPWLETYLEDPSPTLLIANTGLHTTKKPEKFQQEVDQFVDAIEMHRSMRPNDKIFFRTSVPGHANCSEHTTPFEGYHEFRPSNLYDWNNVEPFNEYTKEKISNLNDDYWMLLDVYPMTILRPDGHFKPDFDCLHYQLPGPPDFYVHLLYSKLLDLTLLNT